MAAEQQPALPWNIELAATMAGLADWVEIELAGGVPAKAVARALVVQLRHESDKLWQEAGRPRLRAAPEP